MKELFFKATRRTSRSYWPWAYKEILKHWDLDIDCMKYSDDVIYINLFDLTTWEPKFKCLWIDYSNWEYRIFLD